MTSKRSTLKSMTAYGRSQIDHTLGRFVLEIQSLNRKHLEINCFFPREMMAFEIDVRNLISSQISRGQININLTSKFGPSQKTVVFPNLSLALSLKEAWQKIAKELNVEEEFHLNLIKSEKEIFQYEKEQIDPESLRTMLKSLVQQSLSQVLKMKEQEGATLQEDIELRLNNLVSFIQAIEGQSLQIAEKLFQKLKCRLEELFGASEDTQERLLKEVALYSDKVDITEEITRFKSHLSQFNHYLDSQANEPLGKIFEFLIQELNREINTIGSKAADASISHLVVRVKAELEKIREQLQNIE